MQNKLNKWLLDSIGDVRKQIISAVVLYLLSNAGILWLKDALQMPVPLWLVIVISLSILFGCAILILIHSYKNTSKVKNKLIEYEFINPPGCFKHKKSGLYFCQPCLLKNKIESELSWINECGMQCKCCGMPYKISLTSIRYVPSLEKEFDQATEEWNKNNQNG